MNHHRRMEQHIDQIPGGRRPRLLLHACCAPCSTRALECLTRAFDVHILYYNPNILPRQEHDHRLDALAGLCRQLDIPLHRGRYEPDRFLAAVEGLEEEPEGGERCRLCFALRLGESARLARGEGFGYLTTSLTTGPRKDADAVNQAGEQATQSLAPDTLWLPADFKKKGYRRSVELSRQYGLYRQRFCGCPFSLGEREIPSSPTLDNPDAPMP